jgi:hypothetical protein
MAEAGTSEVRGRICKFWFGKMQQAPSSDYSRNQQQLRTLLISLGETECFTAIPLL